MRKLLSAVQSLLLSQLFSSVTHIDVGSTWNVMPESGDILKEQCAHFHQRLASTCADAFTRVVENTANQFNASGRD